MKNFIILLLITPLILSCEQAIRTSEENCYRIDLNTAKEVAFESIFKQTDFLPLETVKDHEIGQIGKILKMNNLYVILDPLTNSVFLFNENGKYEYQILAIGNGPGEYARIMDLCVNERAKEIKILDGMQNKILTFNAKGEFVYETRCPIHPAPLHFLHLSDSLYAFDFQRCSNSKKYQYNLIVSSESFTSDICKYLPYDKPLGISFSPQTTLFRLNDETIYVPLYNSTIYTVSSTQITPRYTFDFGDKWIDQEFIDIQWPNALEFMNKLETMKYVYYFNLLESESHIYSDFMYKNRKYHLIINKENEHIFLQKEIDKYKCSFTGNIIGIIENKFVIILSPEEYNAIMKEKDSTIKESSLLSEDSNPIIMFVSFDNF